MTRWSWALCLPLAGALPAGGASVAERLAPCFVCHGEQGHSTTAGIPSIGGQQPAYLLVQLFMFREKLRVVPAMNEMAAALSDDDLRLLSDALSQLPPPAPEPSPLAADLRRADEQLAAAEHCNSCHNADFSGRDNIPRLAGQREDYLARTLVEYRTTAGAGYDGSMAEVLQPVSAAQIADLAAYLARLP